MDNVTLSSHAAFRTLEASETLIRRAIDIVRKSSAVASCLRSASAVSKQAAIGADAILRDAARASGSTVAPE